MASFDRAIPPGGEGKITLSIRTDSYEGYHRWGAKVDTNDPKWKTVILEVKASVIASISLTPRYVRLTGREDVHITKSIEIKAGLDKPLTLEPGPFNLQGKITYRIEEVEKGRKFRVHFTNIPGVTGSYRGILQLKTNYDEKPILTIRISGRFVKAETNKE